MRISAPALAVLLFILASAHSFSETQTGHKSPLPSISMGAYGVTQIALGSYAAYASVMAGGGDVELAPVYTLLPEKMRR